MSLVKPPPKPRPGAGSSGTGGPANVFKSAGAPAPKLAPLNERSDRFSRYGRLLLLAWEQPSALERHLAVTRLILSLLCDLLSPSLTPTDVPLITTGQHSVNIRSLGIAADGSVHKVTAQEISGFDEKDGPKPPMPDMRPGPLLGSLHWVVRPVARAKTRRLGREEYVKVTLGSGGTLQLLGVGGTAPPTVAAAATASTGAAPAVQSPQGGEQYSFNVPPLVLLDPLSPSCVPGLRGDLVIKCDSTGLVTLLTLGDEGDVEGTIERSHTSPSVTSMRLARVHGNLHTSVIAEVLGSDALTPSHISSTASSGQNVPPPPRSAVPGPRHYPLLVPVSAATGGIHHTAVLAGSTSRTQGPQGLSSAARAGGRGQQAPPPAQLLSKMDLSSLCALRLPRLWAAVADALMYNSAEAASGKNAKHLSRRLSRRLSVASFACGRDPGALALGGGGRGNAAGGGGGDSSGDDEEEEDAEEVLFGLAGQSTAASTTTMGAGTTGGTAGGTQKGEQVATKDTRKLPPAYKEMHTGPGAGNMMYQMHLALNCSPHNLLQ